MAHILITVAPVVGIIAVAIWRAGVIYHRITRLEKRVDEQAHDNNDAHSSIITKIDSMRTTLDYLRGRLADHITKEENR
jgi:hypothetical protein